jgi:hypothetical protein
MSWLSLAANRYEMRASLQRNLNYAQESRTKAISSMLGRYAMLSGDEFHIEREIKIAETILTKYPKEARPPHPYVLSDVMDLAIIASLGEKDFFDVFESIAEAEIYQDKEEKSLQLLARRIVGLETVPAKPYKKRGHIKKAGEWLRLVKDNLPADVFNLAVTPEHDESYLLEKFILPLGFLLAKSQEKEDWRIYLKQLLSWGGANLEKRKNIVYERIAETPDVIGEANPDDKSTWWGFDAVEVRDEEIFAYYYLGTKWEAPLFFQDEINVYRFLDDVEFDWKLVEENVDTEIWDNIAAKRKQDKCTYVVVYDAASAYAPEQALERAREHYGLKIVTNDITEV